MAEAIAFGCPFQHHVQLLALTDEILVGNLTQSFQESRLTFLRIKESHVSPVTYDEAVHLLPAGDPTLASFQIAKERLQLVVGARQAIDLIAGE